MRNGYLEKAHFLVVVLKLYRSSDGINIEKGHFLNTLGTAVSEFEHSATMIATLPMIIWLSEQSGCVNIIK